MGQGLLLAPAYADWQPDATGKTVDLDLSNADLHAVVEQIQRQTGVQVVVEDGSQPYGLVTLQLHGAPVGAVLHYIAESANASLTQDSDGVYVFSPAGANAPAPAVEDEDYQYYKIKLEHAVPADLLYLMHWDQDVRTVDPYQNAANADFSVKSNMPAVEVLSQDSTPSVPGARGNVGQVEANRSIDESVDAGDSQAHQFPNGFSPGGFSPGFTPGGFNNGAQQGANARGGGGGLPPGVDHVYAVQGDNSILIHATPEAFERIRKVIEELDIAPKQVELKVQEVTAKIDDVDAFGIDYQALAAYPSVDATSNLLADANINQPSYQINIAQGNLVAEMQAQLTRDHSRDVSTTIVTTTNNTAGGITTEQTIPYTTTSGVLTNGSAATTTQVQFLTVPNTITITPRINSDDSVTLPLHLNISTVNGNASPPTVNTETVTGVRTVRNGETMVIGGSSDNTDDNVTQSIPILGDLPIIGNLFRSRDKTVDDTETLFFITTTVIDEGSSSTDSDDGVVTP